MVVVVVGSIPGSESHCHVVVVARDAVAVNSDAYPFSALLPQVTAFVTKLRTIWWILNLSTHIYIYTHAHTHTNTHIHTYTHRATSSREGAAHLLLPVALAATPRHFPARNHHLPPDPERERDCPS